MTLELQIDGCVFLVLYHGRLRLVEQPRLVLHPRIPFRIIPFNSTLWDPCTPIS